MEQPTEDETEQTDIGSKEQIISYPTPDPSEDSYALFAAPKPSKHPVSLFAAAIGESPTQEVSTVQPEP